MASASARVQGNAALARLRASRIARNLGWATAGDVVALVSQFWVFVVVARGLGNSGYGSVAGTVSLMLFLGPLAACGAPFLLVTYVANRGEDLSRAISRATRTALVSGLLLSALLALLHPLVLPQVSRHTFVALALAELVFNQQVQVCRFAFQSVERLSLGAAVAVVYGVSRALLASVYFAAARTPTAERWAGLYLLGSAIGALAGRAVLRRLAGRTQRATWPSWRDIREGLGYSTSLSASYLKNDADKALLLRLGERAASGDYSAAYRVLGVVTLPVGALADATYARLFSSARESYRTTYQLAVRATAAAAVWASLSGVAVFAAAPLLERAVGADYADAVTAIRWLSAVPLLLALQLFAANALSACDAHAVRVRIGIVLAFVNAGLNLALIPSMSWRGSVVATFVSELLSLVLIWRALHHVVRRSPAPAGVEADT